MASIRERVPSAKLEFVRLDLASLSSVAEAAAQLAAFGPIDGLVENAGLTVPSKHRRITADGLELTVGANALGHFALAAQLWPSLAPTGRIVALGSMATRMVRFDPGDLLSGRRYRPFRAYAFSKHAVEVVAIELDRRIRAAGGRRLSLLAHPGYSAEGLSERRPGINDVSRSTRLRDAALTVVAQGKHRGSWPSVRAALDPDAASGQYYGPSRTLNGPPVVMARTASRASSEFGAQLWSLAEQRTGVVFAV